MTTCSRSSPTSTSRPTSSNESPHRSSKHTKSDQLLLGIDPGLASTGWALLAADSRVAACGTIKTAPGPAGPRLLRIVREVRALLEAHAVREAALEELFMGRNATSAIAVAQARGAILAVLEEGGVAVFEYKPASVKSVLTGYGMAGKQQLQRMVAVQAKGSGAIDDHAADAIAIAICHARSRRLRMAAQSSEQIGRSRLAT